MHFQLPPHDHYKLVVCLAGGVLDVVLDLRRGSPAYGKFESFELTGRSPQLLLIPPGLAHGFCVTEAPATMYYKVTTAYSPAHDSGVRWNSIGFEWPVNDPLVSARDAALPALADFQSPFVYSPGI
jgi:dTDP-4-dehydrorhamnose 3,5-epimerase